MRIPSASSERSKGRVESGGQLQGLGSADFWRLSWLSSNSRAWPKPERYSLIMNKPNKQYPAGDNTPILNLNKLTSEQPTSSSGDTIFIKKAANETVRK